MNIILAFPKIETGRKIKSILARNGFLVTSILTTGTQVLAEAHTLQYGIVITSYRLKDMLYNEIQMDLPPAMKMITLANPMQWEENPNSQVVCIPLPLKVYDLLNTVEMVALSAEQIRKREKKKPRKRTKEEELVLVRAKGVLMERNQMTEDEAHHYLQKMSMDSGNTLKETAYMILNLLDGK